MLHYINMHHHFTNLSIFSRRQLLSTIMSYLVLKPLFNQMQSLVI